MAQSPTRYLCTLLLLFLVAGCKIKIIVPEGATVHSLSGDYQCAGPAICLIDVSDTGFDETFTVTAPPGQRFSAWRTAERFLCGGGTTDCRLFTTTFPGTPLMAVLNTDDEFSLEPIFEAGITNTSFWQTAVAIERDAGYRRNQPTQSELYLRLPDTQNCDSGEITQQAKNLARNTLNAIRSLHGLPSVAYLSEFDAEVQAASLVQLANSGSPGHFPSPSDACYSQLADDGAGTSNLFFGQADQNPTSYMIGWAHDADNVASVMATGHRRHVLNPNLGYVSYGSTLGFAAQKVFGFGRGTVNASVVGDFIGYPEGAYPYVLADKDRRNPTPWSVHAISRDPFAPQHNYFANASVDVVDRVTGDSVVITNLYSDSTRYGGLYGTLAWIVPDYEYDREYEVTVSGIAMPGGNIREHRYSVVLQRQELLVLDEPLESGDSVQSGGLNGAVNNPDDRDTATITISSAGSYQLNAQTMFGNWALFVEVYDAAKNLLTSTDEPVTLELTAGEYTVAVGRCSAQGNCYGWDNLSYKVELR
ncbi:MAG: hypothetical protein AAF699_22350 [Pseudomonadota bacterium]